MESFNIAKLRVRSDREKYQIEIKNRFQAISAAESGSRSGLNDDPDPDRLWKSIEGTVKAAAKTILGKKKKPKSKPWFDEECELWFERES